MLTVFGILRKQICLGQATRLFPAVILIWVTVFVAGAICTSKGIVAGPLLVVPVEIGKECTGNAVQAYCPEIARFVAHARVHHVV